MKFSFKIFQSIVQKMFNEIVHIIVRQIFIQIVPNLLLKLSPKLTNFEYQDWFEKDDNKHLFLCLFDYSKLSTDEILSKCIFVQFRVVYNCIGSWELGTFVCSTRMGQNDKMLHFRLPESPDLLPFCIGHYHDLTRFYNIKIILLENWSQEKKKNLFPLILLILKEKDIQNQNWEKVFWFFFLKLEMIYLVIVLNFFPVFRK